MLVEKKLIWMNIAVYDAFAVDKGDCFGGLLCLFHP